jgi:uncharacterized protein YjiS (DUF1127 family)
MSALTRIFTEATAEKPSFVAGFFMGLLNEIRIRRALHDVGSLDDAALHDIGINPGGIEEAVRCGRR